MTTSVFCRTLDDPEWKAPLPAILSLAGDAHIWRIPIPENEEALSDLLPLLDAAERQKVSLFRQAIDRQRFILGHGMLRQLAGRHFGMAPEDLILERRPHGKPFFRPTLLSQDDASHIVVHPLHFNISHAGDWTLLAFAGSSLGIDIEEIKEDGSSDELMDRVFSPTEVEFLGNSLTSPCCFFLHWTRKEALLKAIARGLDDGLPEIPCLDGWHEMSPIMVGREESRFIGSGGSGIIGPGASCFIGSSATWIVSSFRLPCGYIASIAHQDHVEKIHFWE